MFQALWLRPKEYLHNADQRHPLEAMLNEVTTTA